MFHQHSEQHINAIAAVVVLERHLIVCERAKAHVELIKFSFHNSGNKFQFICEKVSY